MNLDARRPESLYIHIPFCSSRCDYCGFFSTISSFDNPIIKEYINRLVQEWTEQKSKFIFPLKSVYMGGGTPGIIPPQILDVLVKQIEPYTDSETEWTIECNPEHLSPEILTFYNESPINRISLGVQSLENEELVFLNRKCSKETALEALSLISENWKGRWSADLLHAIPGNPSTLKSSLEKVISFNPGHLSLYTLTYEEGTPLYTRMKALDFQTMDQDTQDHLWEDTVLFLETKGYKRYEISNFCREKEFSRHNSAYWDLKSYLGLGSGAVSMIPDSQGSLIRYQNETSVDKYITGKYSCTDYEKITDDILCKDLVLMGLRTAKGVDVKKLEDVLEKPLQESFSRTLRKYSEYFNISPERVFLNNKGLDILNSILVDMFLEIEELFLDS